MSRTGSTSEQRLPTSWRPWLRLALIAGPLLTAATPASAGWTVRNVPGTPTDVEVWDATRFSVSTTSGVWLYSKDGGMLASIPTNGHPATPIGSYLTSQGCFLAFMSDDNVLTTPNACGDPDGPVGAGSIATLIKAEGTETGAVYVLSREGTPSDARVTFTPPGGVEPRPWLEKEVRSGSPMTLGAERYGGSEHALMALGFNRDVLFYWLVDGDSPPASIYRIANAGLPPKEVQTIDLFPAGGSAPTALYGWDTGLYRGVLARSGGSFQEVPLPGGPGQVTALDVNTPTESPC
jgi:hypothetical protein